MKISEIKELIQLVNDTEINEMELQKEEVKLILRKTSLQGHIVNYQQIPIDHQPQVNRADSSMAAVPVAAPTPAIALQQASPLIEGQPVIAPMVGTFYRAPRPDAEPFIKKGDRVKAGQSICIIEAMKLMNEIEAEFSGIVVDILVEDGVPVEYGQTLFIIDPDKELHK